MILMSNDERNIKIAQLLSNGATRKEIAYFFDMSVRNVEVILDKLRNQHEAIHIAHLTAILIRKKLIA
jgi:DNA-binding CsgD family transcriptional regulator